MFTQQLKKVTGLLLLVLISQVSLAQNKVVTGKVTDARDGTPLQGATVSAKGNRSGTQTDAKGVFSLTVDNSVSAIVISSVGFNAQEISLDGKTSVEVAMAINNTSLGEVVVIGYGTARRKDLTGSVSTVSTKDFNKGPLTSPEQLINGKVAGVQITAPSGAPGSGGRIRVRGTSSLSGSNDPLIIIDGVPVDQQSGISGSNNPLAMINPNDIETFNILKDASATAIYGNRATNGVIIITTKKGKSGKFRLSFSTLNSYSVVGDKLDVLNADEFKAVVNGKGNNSQKGLLGSANTNWQDQVYDNAFATDNNIAMTGGIKNFPYRFSLGYLKQNGILKTGTLGRFSTALNLNPRLLKNSLKVDLNLKATFSDYFFANEGAIGGSAFFDPTQVINRNDNRFGGYWEWLANNNQPDGLAPKNPVGQLNLRDDQSDVTRIITNLQLDYTFPFLKDLRAVLNVGYDYSKGQGTVYIMDSAAMSYIRGGVNNKYEQTKKNKLLDFYLNYVKDLKTIRSRLDITAGYGYQDFMRMSPNYPDYRANGQEFAPANPFPFETQNTLVSFYGRANFSVHSKYLFTATLRRDGSSRFSPDTRWGWFPSAAFAWNISEESFLKGNKVLSNLKLRLGYGVTGQQEIATNDYPYIANYTLGAETAQYQFGNTFYQVQRPVGYDANIKWEETKTINIGIDFGFLNGRISGSIDYYNKETIDLLSLIDVPAGTNFTNRIYTNVGDMNNKGIEFTLNSNIIRKTKLTWDLGFNITYNKNEVTKLTKVDDPTFIGVPQGGISGGVGNTIQIHSIGYRPNSFFVLQQVYTDQKKPIEGLYVDRNKDGVINNLDYYRYQSPEPTVVLGFNTAVSYEKWNFSTVLRANFGNYMYNNIFSGNGVFQPGSQSFLNNVHRNYQETGFGTYQYFSDYYVENASFLRMDNFTVSYDFGKVFNNKANLRVTGNVQNVFVTSKY
ncbi:MAG: SusC/RagA family TonB-linked outer membrane protein, partial [Chitinophagaceae bacterium]|nr:SusC/RagA family TonB-linked outer membrane protein [Chitinophagaceae bacterium]